MGPGPIKTTLNFEIDLDYCMDTKISGFFYLRIVMCLGRDMCSLSVLVLVLIIYGDSKDVLGYKDYDCMIAKELLIR